MMMKRTIIASCVTLGVAVTMIFSSPFSGNAEGIVIGTGSGTDTGYGYDDPSDGLPIVQCTWEQQPIDIEPNMEDGDTGHDTSGFQILPPLEAGSTKTICYYAVVYDVEEMGNVAQAFADVYHPVGSPEPYGPSVVGGIPSLPYFKYEIPFTIAGHSTEVIDMVQAAYDAGLITFNSSYDLESVMFDLDKGIADLWTGCAPIDYEQPAGMYDVYVYAIDSMDNFSAPLVSQFYYVPVCGIEADFAGISFDSANLGTEKMVPGDTVWDSPAGINHATVRNVGNVWTSLSVKFDDMGFGQDVDENWNVRYGARMGSNDAYYVGNILPYQEATLPNALGLSKKEEIDFSITIIKGSGIHTGEVTIKCITVPFEDPVPEWVVGIDATGDY